MQNFEERLRTCVRQEGRHLSDIIFRNWVINVSNENCIYYRLFWCWHNFFILKINEVTIIWKKHAFFLRHPEFLGWSNWNRYNVPVIWGRREIHTRFWLERREGKRAQRRPSSRMEYDIKIDLKRVGCINLAQSRNWVGCCENSTKIGFQKCGHFLASWGTATLPRRNMLSMGLTFTLK